MNAGDYLTEATNLLAGSIDTHIHGAPDVIPRKLNDIEIAQDAARAKMRAVALVSHVSSTAGRAFLAHHAVPQVNVFGGIILNTCVGGLNPAAVQVAIKMGAKIIWMPTVSSLHFIHAVARSPFLKALGGGVTEAGFTLDDENGKLKPQVIEILDLIKEADIILSTGGISNRESLLLVDEALRRGLKRVVWEHPDATANKLPLEQQKTLAARGIFFERCWSLTHEATNGKFRVPPEEYANAIKTVGAATTVMASDHGHPGIPTPVEGFRDFIAAMLSYGISSKEIEVMIKTNPAQLLGL
jgi:hypothetical protein